MILDINLNSIVILELIRSSFSLSPSPTGAEIYGDIVFDHPHTCAAEFEDVNADLASDDSNLAVISGVSKGGT